MQDPETFIKLLESHPLIGYVLFFVVVFLLLANHFIKNLPIYSLLKAKVLIPFAQQFKFVLLQKAAIKNDIQGKFNFAIRSIKDELPSSDIKPLEIQWVKNSTKEVFIRENKVFVRIRPLDNQEDNFLNVTEPFLESVLLPKSKYLIQEVQKKAIIYFTTSVIISSHERLVTRFHDKYYLPESRKYKSLSNYYEKIEQIYKKGFFFSIAIRALELCADNQRFKKTDLGSEFSQILDHLLNFIENIGMEDDFKWHFNSTGITYSMLLVAMPMKAHKGDVKAYVNRAKEHFKKSQILFVSFSNKEKEFGAQVTDAINAQLPVELIAELRSQYDYRGHQGGIVRVFKKVKMIT